MTYIFTRLTKILNKTNDHTCLKYLLSKEVTVIYFATICSIRRIIYNFGLLHYPKMIHFLHEVMRWGQWCNWVSASSSPHLTDRTNQRPRSDRVSNCSHLNFSTPSPVLLSPSLSPTSPPLADLIGDGDRRTTTARRHGAHPPQEAAR